jgi:hypothetical protein
MLKTGKFTQNKTATFPYLQAGIENQTIYSPECAPDDFRLIDPDHLTAPQVEALYMHWLRRQQKKLPPFIILNPSPQHKTSVKLSQKAKGKRKMEYTHVDSDDPEVQDEDSDKNGGTDESEDEDSDENGSEDESEDEDEDRHGSEDGSEDEDAGKTQQEEKGSSREEGSGNEDYDGAPGEKESDSEGQEETHRNLKIGPPGGSRKRNRLPIITETERHQEQVPGPSTIRPPKDSKAKKQDNIATKTQSTSERQTVGLRVQFQQKGHVPDYYFFSFSEE